MTFKSLKQVVYQSLVKTKFNGEDSVKEVNEILTGCLLLKALKSILKQSASYQDGLQRKSDEFVATYQNISESLEGRFVSYKKIKEKIKNYKLGSFLQITETQVDEIYKLYENKAEIKEFNAHTFSQFMYQTMATQDNEVSRLSRVHFKVVVPIIEYYMSNFNIRTKDVSLEDVGNRLGTEIKISISGIRTSQLYSDISRNLMNVKHYIYDINITPDSFVKIYIK